MEPAAPHYIQTSNWQREMLDRLLTLVASRVPRYRDKRVLADIGCGPGARTEQLLRFFPALDEYLGIDLNAEYVAYANRAYGSDRVRFVEAAGDDPLPDGFAPDIVILNWSAHWIPDKTRMLENVRAAGNSGLHVALSTDERLPEFFEDIDEFLRSEFGDAARAPRPFHYLDYAGWRAQFESARFRILAEERATLLHRVTEKDSFLEHWCTASSGLAFYLHQSDSLSGGLAPMVMLDRLRARLDSRSYTSDGADWCFSEEACFFVATPAV